MCGGDERFTDGETGGEAPAEGVAGAGGIQYGDVGGRDTDRWATRRTDQRTLLAALHDHRRHPLGLQLAASPLGVVVADNGGEFPVAGYEHVDTPSEGENVVPPGRPGLVGIQGHDRPAALGPEVPDDTGSRPEGHGSDVDYRRAVLLQVGPRRWDVLRARRHLEATLRRRPVHPAAVPVVLVDHPVADRRTFDRAQPAGVEPGVAEAVERRDREVRADPRHHSHR